MRRTPLLLPALLLLPTPLGAGGGPHNVLVVVNDNSQESLEIGQHYLRARDIPAANLCRVQTTTELSTSKAVYQTEIELPVEQCIAASPHSQRIDYIVLTRGVPIRAQFPGGRVSTAALLQAMDTPLRGKDQEYDAPYGFTNHPNPYRNQPEWFSHSKSFGGYNLYLVTMLSGYWSEDAIALVDRSLASDGNPPTDTPGATFYLEQGNPAADVRNAQMPAAAAALVGRGYQAETNLLGDPDVTGAVVASHINSGSYSGISRAEIESNSYPPGAVVDVFESFGLVPANFDPTANPSQVPVTWWVSAGITGAHGTVSEPYNVAFPDAFMLEPFVDGFNLAEAFYQGIPYLYWMNLVLADPLAAPWATPPSLQVDEPADSATVSGNVRLRASAASAAGIERLEFFVGDTLVGSVNAASGQQQWDSTQVADGWHRVSVVAYDQSPQALQARASVWVQVDNLGASVSILEPADGSRVGASFQATIDASTGQAALELWAEDLMLGSLFDLPPQTLSVDTTLLGRGWHSLVASAVGSASAARSPRVDVYVVKAPSILRLDVVEGPQSGGTAVSIEGWGFEPDVRVFFGVNEASDVVWLDANRLQVTTPPGPAGPVEVRALNPFDLEGSLTDGFTYLPSPCAVTAPIEGLKLVKQGAELALSWQPSDDPCLTLYHSFTVDLPAPPLLFPDDWSDITGDDTDGDPGGDAGFVHTPSAAPLSWYSVVGEGSDGSLGP